MKILDYYVFIDNNSILRYSFIAAITSLQFPKILNLCEQFNNR